MGLTPPLQTSTQLARFYLHGHLDSGNAYLNIGKGFFPHKRTKTHSLISFRFRPASILEGLLIGKRLSPVVHAGWPAPWSTQTEGHPVLGGPFFGPGHSRALGPGAIADAGPLFPFSLMDIGILVLRRN